MAMQRTAVQKEIDKIFDLVQIPNRPKPQDYVDTLYGPRNARTILVAGSRTVFDLGRVMAELAAQIDHATAEIHIIAGGCPTGPDKFAKQYAGLNRLSYTEYRADWDGYGKAAGPIRNAEMVKACNEAIVFWDGKSAGTKNTIALLGSARKPYVLYCWPEYATTGPRLIRDDEGGGSGAQGPS